MAPTPIRVLRPGDEAALDRYLASRPDTTLFFRNNLREVGGLGADPDAVCGGVYAACFDGEAITGVAARFWNGNGALEADTHQAELLRTALAASGRPLYALLGPARQVAAARADLGLSETPTSLDSVEDLFALEIAHLRVPPALARGEVVCRRATEADLERLVPWRAAYFVEALGVPPGEKTDARARDTVARATEQGRAFVLEQDGELVSFSAFNAWIPACAQIGGVYTPPALRSRGYGRAVVAGSLQIVQAAEGTPRSVLFTDQDNRAAQRAYVALGYERVGDYALVFFEQPHEIR